MEISLGKQIPQKMSICLGLGGIGWILLLLHGAQAVHNSEVDTHYLIRFGPLQLNELSKIARGNTFVVGLGFKAGFVAYLGLCMVCGILWAFLVSREGRKK